MGFFHHQYYSREVSWFYPGYVLVSELSLKLHYGMLINPNMKGFIKPIVSYCFHKIRVILNIKSISFAGFLFKPIYTWNPNDHCFDWKRPCFGGLKPNNRGQIGSRYIYIYFYLYTYHKNDFPKKNGLFGASNLTIVPYLRFLKVTVKGLCMIPMFRWSEGWHLFYFTSHVS